MPKNKKNILYIKSDWERTTKTVTQSRGQCLGTGGVRLHVRPLHPAPGGGGAQAEQTQ
jgi:hypothetical protein